MTLRSAFVATTLRLLGDENVVLLLGDISTYAFKEAFERYPKRCYNLGIAEQASVGIAAGLALAGFYPIYHTIDAFMVRRAYEFIRLDFGEQKLAGLFISVGGSNEYKKLGPTHQCREGVALMSQVPGMYICQPRDEEEAALAITAAVTTKELTYVRLEENT